MNYLILLLILVFLYYIINISNKSILFLVIIGGVYIYYENILPDTFWEIPEPLYRNKFEFQKLDKLIKKYKKGDLKENILLDKDIQHEINTIYFSFPNHLHLELDKYLYSHYGFNKSV